jgi:hypothetical protein
MLEKRYSSPRVRAEAFANRLDIRLPILLAPMAGACPPSLSIAVANAGGLGACGALLMTPDQIIAWASEFRKGSPGAFQINLWIPEPPPVRDLELENQLREFLAKWGPPVPPEAGDATLPDFAAQCQAMHTVAPQGDFVNYGGLSTRLRIRTEGTRNPVVCECHYSCRGESCCRGGCRRDRRARHGGRRSSRNLPRGGGGGPIGRLDVSLAADLRCSHCTRHRGGWHRRCSGSCSGADPGRKRGADRNRIPAISGSENEPGLC